MKHYSSNWFRPVGISIGVLLICAALGVILIGNRPQAKGTRSSSIDLLMVKTITVSSRPLTARTRATGLLEPIRDITLFAETSGQISSRPLEEDSAVKRGEILLTLDDTYKKTAVARAKAALAEARSGASFQHSQSQRARELYQSKVISSEERDRQLNREAVASAALRVAQERLREAQEDLSKTVIKSPIDGIVVTFFFERFEFVREGQPVARVIDSKRLKLIVEVPDRERVGVVDGTKVTIKVDSFPGEIFNGTTVRVSQAASAETNKFPVEIQLANPEGKLLPGMIAEASIPLTARRQAILVPRESVIQSFGQHQVFVADGDAAMLRAQRRYVTVKPVPFLPTQFEVTEGLKDGDRVITNRLRELKDGMLIKAAD